MGCEALRFFQHYIKNSFLSNTIYSSLLIHLLHHASCILHPHTFAKLQKTNLNVTTCTLSLNKSTYNKNYDNGWLPGNYVQRATGLESEPSNGTFTQYSSLNYLSTRTCY